MCTSHHGIAHAFFFLRAVSSSEYAAIVSTLQSNIDTYRHPDDESFLPQHFRLTNVATLIHNNAKARGHDVGNPRISRVALWDSAYDVLDDDELQFCHIQGYEPRVYPLEQGRNHGSSGHEMDRRSPRGPDQRQGFEHRQDRTTFSGDHGTLAPRGRFARPDLRRRTFMPDKQCAACKRVGHEAVNCNMLAIALFVDRYVHHSLLASD
jgi:hypothetical protein